MQSAPENSFQRSIYYNFISWKSIYVAPVRHQNISKYWLRDSCGRRCAAAFIRIVYFRLRRKMGSFGLKWMLFPANGEK